MTQERIIKTPEIFLKYSLVGILTLLAGGFVFIFTINQEDWFFGTKLDGFPAGMSLVTKAALAIIIVCLILLSQKNSKYIAILALCYIFIIFLDSASTIQKNTGGTVLFSKILGILLVIPLVLYIFRIPGKNLGTIT